jgi:5-methylcytosine-specific restriction endonuclease McrA
MKYKLEPDNRNCPDKTLLDDLRATAARLGTGFLTKDQYDKYGRFCAATMQRRFGSWAKALASSGLRVTKRMCIPRDELPDDVKRVAAELATDSVTTSQYKDHGKFDRNRVSREFGSWAALLDAAGLQGTGWRPRATDDDLMANMAAVWEHVGRQPKQTDLRHPVSRYSAGTYKLRYGSWRAALEAFVRAANSESDGGDEAGNPESDPRRPPTTERRSLRTARAPGWRLRYLVMRRDNFACRLCGASPAKDPAVSLHIDHIHPWSKGGETVLENLQTCCEACNVGKSALSQDEEVG